jgi:hypothetical protein
MASAIRRTLAGIFAISWFLVPGFGITDLTVTWNPDWPQVLEAGWGVFMTFFVGVPFAAIAIRPAPPPAAAIQLYVAGTTLVISAIAAAEWALIIWGLAVTIETAIVTGIPRHWPFAVPTPTSWLPLAALGLIGAGPWLAYAAQMWDFNRQDRFDTDITMGIDHYSVQGGYGVAALALVAIAALWPAGRRLIGTCVGISAAYLGLVSWAWHPTPGSFNQTWSILGIVWGAGVAVLAFIPTTTAGRARVASSG